MGCNPTPKEEARLWCLLVFPASALWRDAMNLHSIQYETPALPKPIRGGKSPSRVTPHGFPTQALYLSNMKWNKFSLALAATVAITVPALAFDDQHDGGKKHGKMEGNRRQVQKADQIQSSGQFRRGSDRAVSSSSAAFAPTAGSRDFRSTSRSQRNQQVDVSVQSSYARNRGSRDYWVPENVYRGWDRHSRHYYGNHYYHWYNGAWVIIEPGYSTDYYVSDSIVSRVQARLAQKGYYRGPIDGDAGPGTRAAIAAFQERNDLRVTGHINGALLEALHLD